MKTSRRDFRKIRTVHQNTCSDFCSLLRKCITFCVLYSKHVFTFARFCHIVGVAELLGHLAYTGPFTCQVLGSRVPYPGNLPSPAASERAKTSLSKDHMNLPRVSCYRFFFCRSLWKNGVFFRLFRNSGNF